MRSVGGFVSEWIFAHFSVPCRCFLGAARIPYREIKLFHSFSSFDHIGAFSN